MPNTTVFSTERTLIAASTTCSAGGAARAALDLLTKHGGAGTVKITNGATGPTAQAVATLHIAHTKGALPATGAAGATWKTWQVIGGGTTFANQVTELNFDAPPGVHIQVEITGNTGQDVTCEAFVSELTRYETA